MADSVEPESLEGLFAAYEEPLLRYAQKLVHNLDTAQEIVQETFMRLHRNFATVRQPRPWLYQTAHNLAMNHLRAGTKIVPLDFTEDSADLIPEPGPGPVDQLKTAETIAQTRHCLEQLEARERELIHLKFNEGLSYKQMSEKTGLSSGNVGFILHHALKKLADQLQKKGVSL